MYLYSVETANMNHVAYLSLVLNGGRDFATDVLIIIGLFLGIGVGYLVVKYGWKTIMNEPGGIGYNSKYGSGASRFRRAKTDADTGGHMKSYRF